MYGYNDRTSLELIRGYVFAHGEAVNKQLKVIEQGLDKLMQSHAALGKQHDTFGSMLDAVLANQVLAADVREKRFAALSGQLKGLGDGLAEEIRKVREDLLAAKLFKALRPPRPAKRRKRAAPRSK